MGKTKRKRKTNQRKIDSDEDVKYLKIYLFNIIMRHS